MKYPLLDLKKEYETIADEVDEQIKNVILSSNFILNSEVEVFEQNFADFTGTKYCIGVGSGTAALFLSLKALDIKKGDEVITTPHTFAATAEAISYCGATPIFVDIDNETFNIDLSKIEEKITEKTKAILPVHLYGYPVDMDELMSIANKHGLFVIEDSAQAHGAFFKNKHVGSFGNAGCFSFYPGKNLGAYGDGGAVVTNDKALYKKIKMLRNHGRVSKYEHELIGYCERLDNLQAAILNVKLKKLKDWNLSRQKVADLYNKYLISDEVFPPKFKKNFISSHYIYTIRVKNKLTRDSLVKYLKEESIATGIYYPVPLHLQKAFTFLGYRLGDFPVAENIADIIISLPMNPFLDKEDIKYISYKVNSFFEKKSKVH